MKKVILFAAALVFTLNVMAQPKVAEVIKVSSETHDFGKVKQGVPVDFVFEVVNITSKPIVVENVMASCGCTTPEKPTEPIMPGESGKIKVQYNAAAVGPFSKDVTIKIAGVDETKVVHIKGEVLTPEG